MAKKYYWLRLQRDFFKRHDIRIIENMPNGKDYILFYLKLLVESIDHEGELRFSETIPYNEDMLATVTETNVDIVRSAMKIFTELGMIEILEDATIFMSECDKLIGSATEDDQREQWRIRQQRHRDKLKLEAKNNMSRDCHVKTSLEKEIEIEKEIEKEIEIEESVTQPKAGIDYQKIIASFNSICVSYPQVKSLSDARKKAIKARLNNYSEAQIVEAFNKAEQSDFLKGKNDRNWMANFDWILKDTNLAKILDGNYDNKKAKPVQKEQIIANKWLSALQEVENGDY